MVTYSFLPLALGIISTAAAAPTYFDKGKSYSVHSYDDTKKAPCGNSTYGWKMCGPSSWSSISQSGVTNMCGGSKQSPINVVSSAVVVDATLTYPIMSAGNGCGMYQQYATDQGFVVDVYGNAPKKPSTPCADPPQMIVGKESFSMLQV